MMRTVQQLNEDLLESANSGDINAVIQYLKLGANPCSIDAYGNTGLHQALAAGHKKVAEILLQKGTDEHIKNINCKTAVDLAEPKIADWFIQKSRSMRLQQLLKLEKSVEELSKEVKLLQKLSNSPTINGKPTFFKNNLNGSLIERKNNLGARKITSKL